MRTSLFSLVPQGLGTVQVESLTSYIRRLALAHVVSPCTLVREQVLKPYRSARGQRHLIFEPSRIGESLNGDNDASRLVVRSLSALTGITELDKTTAQRLAQGIDFSTAFRKRRGWCPACLASSEAYDRLVWALSIWRTCPIHRLPILERCTSCGREHRPLHPTASPACCSWCGADLTESSTTPLSGDVDVHAELIIEQLLALSDDAFVDRTSVATLVTNAALAVGGLRPLGRIAAVSPAELSAISSGRFRPGLRTLVRCVLAAGSTVEGLLALPQKAHVAHPGGRRARNQRGSDPALRVALLKTLDHAGSAPPSLRGFAKVSGVTPAYLRKFLPDLTPILIHRRRDALRRRRIHREQAILDHVRAVLDELRDHGLPASRRMLEARLASPGLLLIPAVRDLIRQESLEFALADPPNRNLERLLLDEQPPDSAGSGA